MILHSIIYRASSEAYVQVFCAIVPVENSGNKDRYA